MKKTTQQRIDHINELSQMNEPYNDRDFDRHYLGVVQHKNFKIIGFSVQDLIKVRKFLAYKNLGVDDLIAE